MHCSYGERWHFSPRPTQFLNRSGVQPSERLASLSIMEALTLQHHSNMVLRGLRGAVNWAPVMPKSGICLDGWQKIFQSGSQPVEERSEGKYLKIHGICLSYLYAPCIRDTECLPPKYMELVYVYVFILSMYQGYTVLK